MHSNRVDPLFQTRIEQAFGEAVRRAFLILVAGVFLVSSCGEDCPEGYSGKDCALRASDAFLGSYEGKVDCGAGNQFASLEIMRDIGPFGIRIDIPGDPGFLLSATVLGDSLVIPDQALEIPDGPDTQFYFIFESKGRLFADTLEFPLIILPAGVTDPEKVVCRYEVMK